MTDRHATVGTKEIGSGAEWTVQGVEECQWRKGESDQGEWRRGWGQVPAGRGGVLWFSLTAWDQGAFP